MHHCAAIYDIYLWGFVLVVVIGASLCSSIRHLLVGGLFWWWLLVHHCAAI